MLIVSQFLRLAAARRAEDVDQNLDENQALEGLLVEVYGGDENAVEAMKKLVSGSQDHVSSIHGDKLSTTCKYPYDNNGISWLMSFQTGRSRR
jgi:hypothetical protein